MEVFRAADVSAGAAAQAHGVAGDATAVGLQGQFVRVRERWRGRVAAIIEKGRVSDPEAAEAEVWAKAWAAFGGMVAREAGRRAQWESGHNWEAWLAQIARRVVIDEKRREEVVRRVYGARAERRPGEEAMAWEEESEAELVADESGLGDPYGGAERVARLAMVAEGLAALPAREAAVVRRWAAGETDREIARVLGMRPHQVRLARVRAVVRLRGLARERGW